MLSSAYGPGTYALSNLKRMTGTESFQQLPERQRRCLVHNREMCQTKKFLDQVQSKCNCVPWALVTEHSSRKVVFISIYAADIFPNTGEHLLWARGE